MYGGGVAAGRDEQWDFFVSYARADEAWAVWVAWVLEEAGFRVLVQAWDVLPGTNWVAGMDAGVARARRTVAVLSAEYTRSMYGAAEWQAAWAADPQGTDRRLLVLRVAECERPGLLGQVMSVDLFDLSEQVARDQVVTAARRAVTGGRGKPEVPPPFPPRPRAVTQRVTFPGQLPPVWNTPGRLARFVGRESQLATLTGQLGATAVVALTGLGGVGKTSLAVEYAHRHASDFDVVWWVDAQQADTVPAQIGELGEALGLPVGAKPPEVCSELRQRGGRWLLVFDNAEDVQVVRPYRPADGRGRVLVTSRRPGWRSVGEAVEIAPLARAESVELLSGRVQGLDAATADQIAELLGDLALAVEQAAAYCEQTATPASTFARQLADRLDEVIEIGEVAERPGITVATLWEFSVAQLAAQTPAALELLELLAFCGPEPVPVDLFAGRSILLGDGPLAAAAADELAWIRTVGALVAIGLAGRDTATVSVHRLVQTTTRRRTSDGRRAEVLAILLWLLLTDLPDALLRSPQGWPRWRELLPHVRAVLALTPDPAPGPVGAVAVGAETQGAETPGAVPVGAQAAAGPPPPDAAPELSLLCVQAGMYLREHGRPAEALPLLRRGLRVSESVCGPRHSVVGGIQNSLALVLLDLGRAQEALPLLRRALAVAEAVHGPRDPRVAIALVSLGGALQDLDRAAESLPLYERALAIDEAAYPPHHPEIGTDLNNMGILLQKLGRHQESLPLIERALAIAEAAHPADHPEIASRLNNLAWTLQHLGRPEDALPLYQRALSLAETVYSPGHPVVARRLSNLALTERTLGRTGQAVRTLRRALAIAEGAYPPDHPDVAILRRNLEAARDADRG